MFPTATLNVEEELPMKKGDAGKLNECKKKSHRRAQSTGKERDVD
jgi:hypothetical protein